MNETAPPEKTWLNGILFLLTVLTTCYAGLSWSASFLFFDAAAGADLIVGPGRVFENARLFPLSALYAAVLMTILVGHEMGHYLTCRRYGARA
ncbi:MAG: hypothetical protein H6P96_1270, partial [Candidatus Aminicenantes bacterium]|nr:hypothetical protein [Candidatus Aminicenantes bacterium]MBS1226260.1 hypothetical protein [Candidatus Aminicenantes bacterium]